MFSPGWFDGRGYEVGHALEKRGSVTVMANGLCGGSESKPGMRAKTAACGAAALFLFSSIGCRTHERHLRKADEGAERTIARLMPEALGREGRISLDRPGDDLRLQLLVTQRLPTRSTVPEDVAETLEDPLLIRMADALRIGARHSSDYQNRKEAVYRAALSLDVESSEFRTSWAGAVVGRYSADESADPARRGVAASAEPTVSRLFSAGASVTSRLAVDLARLLTLDRDTAYGILADATVTVPLLRGAGRRVVLEPMTQAERQVVYALYDFDRFRRTFAVRVASEYLGVLERAQQVRNAEDNVERLELSAGRAQKMADAGRLPATQVDQTQQDVLRARERLSSARQDYERQMDNLKRTLGLPVDARIVLDPDELTRLAEAAGEAEEPDESAEAGAMAWRGMPEEEVVRLALDHRLDLRRAEGRVEDARRAIVLARDALRGTLSVEADATFGERRDIGSAERGDARIRPREGRYRAMLRWDPPWRRFRERARYRESLLDFERAERELVESEDTIKQQIRDHLRGLVQARESRRIQQRAAIVAERRVESTELFLQAGRAEVRDVLEAQEALVSARNALLAAVVRTRTTEWNLRRDMDLLEVSDEGLWHEHETND